MHIGAALPLNLIIWLARFLRAPVLALQAGRAPRVLRVPRAQQALAAQPKTQGWQVRGQEPLVLWPLKARPVPLVRQNPGSQALPGPGSLA